MFHLLIVSSAILSLAIYGRRLPWQNVIAIAAIILGGAGLLEIVNARSGLPFGQIIFHRAFGERLFRVLPWPLPVIWLVVLLNGRSVAELLLKPWRDHTHYGFLLLGLSCGFASFLLFNFQWHSLEIRHDWNFAKGGNIGWAFNSRLLVTPVWFLLLMVWFINKSPVRLKLDFYPVFVWLLLNLYFCGAAFIHRHVVMGSSVLIVGVIVAVLAWKSVKSEAKHLDKM